MQKRFFFVLLVSLIGFFTVGPFSSAQDKVEYRKADKKTDESGLVIEESVGGLKIKPQIGAERTIPVGDIIRVIYGAAPALKIEIEGAAIYEEKEPGKAIDAYGKIVTKLDAKSDKLKRNLEYRIVTLKGTIAGGDPARTTDAIDSMAKFLKDNPSSWQYSIVARSLAQLQFGAGKSADAVKTLETLSSAAPKELKPAVELLVIDAQFRGGDVAAASDRVAGVLATLPASDPNRERYKMLEIGCKVSNQATKPEEIAKELQAAIEKATDPGLKAFGYIVMGDVYSTRKLTRDAMWSWLWVDAVYFQDRNEHIRAMERLANLFDTVDSLKDENRVKFYRDKISRAK